MHPNHEIIKKLMREHLRLAKITWTIEEAGVTVRDLGDINLFEIVLDLIGFPKIPHEVPMRTGSGNEVIGTDRSKWTQSAWGVPKEEVDAFLNNLYTEYNELLQERPELFAENAGKANGGRH